MTEVNTKRILERISIEGFRSFKTLQDFELRPINILIGANGSGKSNFIDFIKLIGDVSRFSLNQQERIGGDHRIWGHDEIVFFKGRESAHQNTFQLSAAGINYTLSMHKNQLKDAKFSLEYKSFKFSTHVVSGNSDDDIDVRESFSKDVNPADAEVACAFLYFLADLQVYHFHHIRKSILENPSYSNQPERQLSRDGSNIANFLLHLKLNHKFSYEKILNRVSMDSPFIEDFVLAPIIWGDSKGMQLNWKQKNVKHVFHPCQLSDGTLRLICLAAALLQPDPPPAVVIDEPELGLHPDAVRLLAESIRDAADNAQVIIATHSPLLVDRFDPKDIIVVNQLDGASHLTRFTSNELKPWIEEYTLGELWVKKRFGR